MNNVMRKIAWITFNAFLDTDLYIVKELCRYYDISWYIIKSGNETVDYCDEIESLKKTVNLDIIECGPRLRSIKSLISHCKLLKRIKRDGYDLLYTCMAGAPYYIPVLSWLGDRRKTIVGIHNVHVPKGGTNAKFFIWYNHFTLRKFQFFQTFSQSQYDFLNEKKKGNCSFWAPFILKDFGSPSQVRTDDRVTFLNFGNIRPYKRLDVLITAAEKAYKETHKEFRVIIAGKCDDWEKYQCLIEHDFLFDIRLGRVENSDIANLFEETDFFVAPYQDIAQSGSAIVAINYEKPIIASRLPAFEEYIIDGDNGYLITPADEEALKSLMVNLIENYTTLYPTLKNRQNNVKTTMFSKDTIVEKYRTFFDGVINNEFNP